MSYDLTRFDVDAATRCRDALRAAAASATSMEGVARMACRHFHEALVDADGERAALMVRCYKTHAYGDLPVELQRTAKRALGTVAFSPPEPGMKCLVLLATSGDEPDWNDRRRSKGHQAIPLPSPHIVARAPMIAQLIEELGFDVAHLVRGTGAPSRDLDGSAYGIFHVEEAKGSPYIPAQDFVDRYGVRSVIGFGGALPTGDLFATIIFSRVPIPVGSADRFRRVALDVKELFLAHPEPVFE